MDIAPRTFRVGRLVEPGPAPAEPVRLVGLVALGSVELFIEQPDELFAQLRGSIGPYHLLLDQLGRIDFAHARMLADRSVHLRLGETRLPPPLLAGGGEAPQKRER